MSEGAKRLEVAFPVQEALRRSLAATLMVAEILGLKIEAPITHSQFSEGQTVKDLLIAAFEGGIAWGFTEGAIAGAACASRAMGESFRPAASVAGERPDATG